MIALITPTGARPQQIKLCADYMKRQTYLGKVLWIIVDDGEEQTTDFITKDFKENWNVVILRPTPFWSAGQNTQQRNLLAGITEVRKYWSISSVFIIEDDDYYCPQYLDTMVAQLKGYDAASEINTIYFNVNLFQLRRNGNIQHGSLFQTAFDISLMPEFEKAVSSNRKFIDLIFWSNITVLRKKLNLFPRSNLSIGIKGMSGRPGIGSGHNMRNIHQNKIEGFMQLKNLIGMDYLNYL